MNDFKKVRVVLMEIDPEKAATWLTSANTNNRSIRKTHVARLSRDMQNGKFAITDSAICFADDGTLINGQHRLMACVLSGRSFFSIVAFNLPKESMEVMDQAQITRTMRDLLAFRGIEVTHKQPGVIKYLKNPGYRGSGERAMTPSEFIEFYESHKENIDWVISHARGNSNNKGVARAHVLAAFARARYHEKDEDLERMMDLMFGRIPIQFDFDNTVNVLVRFLLGSTRNSDYAEIHSKTERAIYGFCRREVIMSLRPVSKELYPLPEEDIA